MIKSACGLDGSASAEMALKKKRQKSNFINPPS
jgi:hypothetical protein